MDGLLWWDPRLHLAAIVVYAAAAALAIAGSVLGRARLGRAASATVLGGIVLHVAALGARWIGSGHGPYVTKYELLSAYALATVVLYLVLSRRHESYRVIAPLVYPLTFMLIAVGLYTGPEVRTLPPTFSGIWLVLHVCFYVAAFSTAVIAVAFAIRVLRGGRGKQTISLSPGSPTADEVSYRFGGLAFAFWGIGMLTGAVWAYYSWGRFWGWDPVETWSLITWVVFAIYLHLRRFFGWTGARAAWLLLGCVALAMFSLFGTSILSGSLHAVYFQ